MEQNRSGLSPRDILFYGNAAYFSKQNIRVIDSEGHAAVVGPDIRRRAEHKVRWYQADASDRLFYRLFEVYDFSAVVFVSGYLTYGNEPDDEIEKLRRLLHQCRKSGLQRGVVLMPQDLCGHKFETRRMELEFMESLCRYYADDGLHIQIVRCPFLVSGTAEGSYFREMLSALENGGDWTFARPAGEKTNFIMQDDLDIFLARLLDPAFRLIAEKAPAE